MSSVGTRACHRRWLALGLSTALLAFATPLAAAPARATSPDDVVRAVLDEIDAHGWNPTMNGLYINWSVDDPSVVNQPGGDVTRHDGLTDLRDLVNMRWYERRHPGDASQAAAIARLEPVVETEFSHYSSDKGWVYWQLLHLTDLTGNPAWTADARALATHLATIIDPASGVSHGPLTASTAEAAASCPDGYRVDHDLESGLALVDAGARFGDPAWSAAGAHEVDVVTGQTYNTTYHLFARIVCQGAVWDQHAKLGEQADDITALLDAGTATHNAAYLARAEEMLGELAGPAAGLHDLGAGGYFFSLDMGSGAVDSSYKESRQLTLLGDLHRANALTGGRFAGAEAEMLRVALQMETPVPLAGYPYREAPQFGFFKSERWITTESAGIALEALQTVLAGTSGPPPLRVPAPPVRRAAPPVAVVPPAPAPPPPAPVAAPPPVTSAPVAATPAAPSGLLPTAPPAAPVRPPSTATSARGGGLGLPWGFVALAAALALAGVDVGRRWRRRRRDPAG
jgi:hypothetical protein